MFLLLLFPVLINAQINTAEYYLDPDQSIHYFDDDWKKSTKSEGDFYRIVTLDSNNVPIGEIKDYYKSGKIQSIVEGAISLDNNDDSNSVWQGKNQIFFESGELQAKLYYVNGKREGEQTYYYKSGKINYTWKTINDKIEGPYKAFYESGEIKEVENWNNGNQLDFTSFHKNSQIKITYKLISGKIDGPWKGFYENGNREQEANFKNGVRVGLLRNFNIEGKLTFIIKFNDEGKKYLQESFFDDGTISSFFNYKEDKRQGISKTFWPNGNLKYERNYKNGLLSGQGIWYNKEGKILSDEKWEDDKIVYWKKFDKFGNVIFEEINNSYTTRFPNGKGVWAYNLNKDFEKIFDDSELEDKEIKFKEYMIFSDEAGFGKPQYRVIMYMEDGLAQTKKNEGLLDENFDWQGKVKWYYPNGKITQSANFIDDKRDGMQYYYNEDGSFERSVSYKYGVKDLWDYKCDDNNQNCEYTYTSYFSSEKEAEAKGWSFYDNEDETSFVPTTSDQKEANNKYYWNKKKSGGVIRYVTLPVESNDDFQFKTTVDWWSGANNKYFGIMVGWKDWENYTRLVIAPNGWHKAEIWKKGVNIGMADGKKVENGGYGQPTTLNIVKINGGTIFSIDGKPIYTSEYSSLSGDRHGFFMGGIQSAVFDNVKVVRTPSSNSSEAKKAPKRNENSEDWAGNGSGIILTSNGYIATNNHVIEDATDIEVEFLYKNEIRSFTARVIQTDTTNDLAIIKIEDPDFDGLGSIPYKFKTNNVLVGESVFALGYPMALSVMGKEIKFTDGKISSRTGYQGDITTYQSTTPIQGGNSGGPLFDSKGNLIAINSAKLKADVADNVSYSIKSSYLLSLIDALPQNISIPNSSVLSTKPLTEKIKTLSKFVVLIKVK